jgi:hypothetical protein
LAHAEPRSLTDTEDQLESTTAEQLEGTPLSRCQSHPRPQVVPGEHRRCPGPRAAHRCG